MATQRYRTLEVTGFDFLNDFMGQANYDRLVGYDQIADGALRKTKKFLVINDTASVERIIKKRLLPECDVIKGKPRRSKILAPM